MKKLLIIISLLAAEISRAQFSTELRVGLVSDKRYNTLSHHAMFPPLFIENLGAGLTELKGNYHFNNRFSASTSARLVTRILTVKYSQYLYSREFYFNVVEIPIGLQYSKSLTELLTLHVSTAGGVNFAITEAEKATVYSLDGDYFQFVKNDKPAWFIQPGLALENKLNEKNSIVFFLNYQFQMSPAISYYSYNRMGWEGSDTRRKGHYLSLGVGYKFGSGN